MQEIFSELKETILDMQLALSKGEHIFKGELTMP
jgi:hypothetical protein